MNLTALKFFLTASFFILFLNFTTAQCPPPGSLQATTNDWQHFHLTWPNVPNAIGYAVSWQYNKTLPVLTEVPESPTAYDLDLGSPLGPTDTLVIQVQTICEGGSYSDQGITVLITNNTIGVSQVSKPIYIIIDDIVIGLEPPLNACLSSCTPWFAWRNTIRNDGQWVGLQPNMASRYLKDAFCTCLSNPRKTEALCLAAAYVDEVPASNILLCNGATERMPLQRNLSSVQITPNPCTDNLRVRIQTADSTINTIARLRLIDLTGRVLYQQQLRLSNGDNIFEIPVDGIPSGILYYDIQMEGHPNIYGKIVKM